MTTTERPLIDQELIDTFEKESSIRFTVMRALYEHKRSNPHGGGLSMLQLQNAAGVGQEDLIFAAWYLRTKKFMFMNDRSVVEIALDGIDYFERELLRYREASR